MQRAVSEILQVVQGVEKLVRAGEAASYPEELRGIYLNLLENQVAESLSHDLVQGLMRELTDAEPRSPQVVRARLLAAIERRVLTAGGIRLTPGRPRVVALVGPTGVGKTTTLAKLATHFRLNERANVSFASIDTYRIGAAGQLQDYARILEVPVRVCLTPQDLAQAVAAHAGEGLVLIDTAGCSPRDSLRMRELKGFLDAAKPDEVHLVLTATAQPDHLFGVLDAYASFGIDRVILTKLDECTRFGLILNVLSRTQGALSYVTLGQCVPKDIATANASKVARLVLGEEPL
jgi:flagellar biosynthesis protein FlhF